MEKCRKECVEWKVRDGDKCDEKMAEIEGNATWMSKHMSWRGERRRCTKGGVWYRIYFVFGQAKAINRFLHMYTIYSNRATKG